MDIESTQLELKVATRTKNKTLIHNTEIDVAVAKQKADALQSISDTLQAIPLPPLVRTQLQRAMDTYKNASERKLNAAKTLDQETRIASWFGFMGSSKTHKKKKHATRTRSKRLR